MKKMALIGEQPMLEIIIFVIAFGAVLELLSKTFQDDHDGENS